MDPPYTIALLVLSLLYRPLRLLLQSLDHRSQITDPTTRILGMAGTTHTTSPLLLLLHVCYASYMYICITCNTTTRTCTVCTTTTTCPYSPLRYSYL